MLRNASSDVGMRYALFALVIWVPLPLGSNRPIFWAINAAFASLIVALFLAGQIIDRSAEDGHAWCSIALLLAGLSGAVVWMLIQSLPLSLSVLTHPIRSRLSSGLASAFDAISAHPSASMTTVAEFAPPVFLTCIAAIVGVKRSHAIHLLNVVVAASTALAAYALTALFFGFDQVLLIDSDAYAGSVTATFVSRNTAATYLALGLVSAAALVGERLEALFTRNGPSFSSRDLLFSVANNAGIYLVAVAILLSALFNTASRAGTAAGLTGLFVVAISTWRRVRSSGRNRVGPFLLMAAFLTGIGIVSSAFLVQRLATVDPVQDIRIPLYRDAIALIAQRPILGHGAGVFQDIYPLFQSDVIPPQFIWNKAHSTYLQAAAELGVPMLVLILFIAAICLWRIGKCIVRRREPAPLSVAAGGAFVVVAMHSLVDFSLQNQAVGIVFAVIAGAGYGEACRLPTPSGKWHAPRNKRFARKVVLLLLCLGLCVMIFAALRLGIIVSATPREVWLKAAPPLLPVHESVDVATSKRAAAASRFVRDAALVSARLDPCKEQSAVARDRNDIESFNKATRECLDILDDGLGANPLAGELWLERAKLLFQLGESGAGMADSMRASYETSSRLGWLAANRVIFGLQIYRFLPEANRKLVRSDLDLVLANSQLAGPLIGTFVASDGFRSLALPILEELDPAKRRVFLSLVKNRVESGETRPP